MCERDPENASDRYAVAVKKEGTTYHRTFASKGIASVFTVFAMVRYYRYAVTGYRKYSADLAQSGHKVPCSLPFKAMLMEPVGSESLF